MLRSHVSLFSPAVVIGVKMGALKADSVKTYICIVYSIVLYQIYVLKEE